MTTAQFCLLAAVIYDAGNHNAAAITMFAASLVFFVADVLT